MYIIVFFLEAYGFFGEEGGDVLQEDEESLSRDNFEGDSGNEDEAGQ
jgi:hypothetical protein